MNDFLIQCSANIISGAILAICGFVAYDKIIKNKTKNIQKNKKGKNELHNTTVNIKNLNYNQGKIEDTIKKLER